MLETIILFWQEHSIVILGALLALSEVLALIPQVKSNSVFTLIINAIKALGGKKDEGQIK